jgi:hypothetical protein
VNEGALYVLVGGVIFLLLVLVAAIVQGAVQGVRGIAAAVANHRAAVRSF